MKQKISLKILEFRVIEQINYFTEWFLTKSPFCSGAMYTHFKSIHLQLFYHHQHFVSALMRKAVGCNLLTSATAYMVLHLPQKLSLRIPYETLHPKYLYFLTKQGLFYLYTFMKSIKLYYAKLNYTILMILRYR